MNMNAILKTTLGIALGFCAFATPGYSSTILQFGKGSASNGTINTSTGVGSMDIGSLSVIYENGASATYTFSAGGFLHFDFNTTSGSQTFALRTTGGGSSLPTAPTSTTGTTPTLQSLQDLTSSMPLYSTPTNLNISVNGGGPVTNDSVSGSKAFIKDANSGTLSTFLDDLGISSSTIFAISGSFQGNQSGALSSDTITFTSVPEPSTIFLFSAGLLAMAVIARKRQATRV